MKNLTIKTAIEIGFDFENADFENKDELVVMVIEFLNENIDKLPTQENECEVSGSGNKQNVNHGDYSSSGEILQYGYDYWKTPADFKHYHSSFLHIDEKTGECFNMMLFQLTGVNDMNS